MSATYEALAIGVLLSVGLGCSSISDKSIGGVTYEGGLIEATSSSYRVFHVEWGNEAIGSLAQSSGIRYVLGSSHLKTGFSFVFNKRKTTIFGFANKESLDKWKAKNSVQSKPPASETVELFEKLNRAVHQSKQSLATALEKLEKQYKEGKQALKLKVAVLRALDLAEAEIRALDLAEAEIRALDLAEAELRASTMAAKPNENQIVAELRR